MPISSGYYTVRNAADGSFLGVRSASTAANASVVTGVETNGNEQIFRVVVEDDSCILYPTHTIGVESAQQDSFDPDHRLGLGGVNSSAGGYAVVSSDAWGYAVHTDRELWAVDVSGGSLTVNGVSYPTYYVVSAFHDDPEIDYYLTSQELYRTNGCAALELSVDAFEQVSKHQQWAFVPSVPNDSDLPVPYLGTVTTQAPPT